jgi:hypothetical protein
LPSKKKSVDALPRKNNVNVLLKRFTANSSKSEKKKSADALPRKN